MKLTIKKQIILGIGAKESGGIRFASDESVRRASKWMIKRYAGVFRRLAK
jgi:hypothetical protein